MARDMADSDSQLLNANADLIQREVERRIAEEMARKRLTEAEDNIAAVKDELKKLDDKVGSLETQVSAVKSQQNTNTETLATILDTVQQTRNAQIEQEKSIRSHSASINNLQRESTELGALIPATDQSFWKRVAYKDTPGTHIGHTIVRNAILTVGTAIAIGFIYFVTIGTLEHTDLP